MTKWAFLSTPSMLFLRPVDIYFSSTFAKKHSFYVNFIVFTYGSTKISAKFYIAALVTDS
jgi:hypothetical protein